ncbi:PilW family protein [Enterovibrio nigricans]|uniref:MSHA biogenesis protein MshO n=1 Tax=Enterovibrio nigricans DSM 22720 TaxID=1121868 RepID=A0A1T4TW34_9GAMM|nr:prepilin-type N-terminal cleavage/methylation domain-containing protein [Enterovibrio nigricans]PKF50818.1 type II secretion system protein [Enterovibrio nigricans]SKA44643.1 MSHA biogenesis protein MshO [Enterovibrio nigricans DSM 22720]
MPRQHGFTLIEIIVTLTILAIVSIGISGFLESGAQGYVEAKSREALQSQARFVVERLGREIRHAVPGSLLISDNDRCVRYTPIQYTGFYSERVPDVATLSITMSKTGTNWIGAINKGGYRIAFLPMVPRDLNDGSTQSYAITSVNATGNELTLARDTSKEWPAESPSQRFYIYKDAVNFCFDITSGALTRQEGSGDAVVLAEGLQTGSDFSLDTESLSRSNMLRIHYRFAQGNEVSVYNQHIQVMNAP